MTLKKNATDAEVRELRKKTGPVVELGVDKAERSGSEAQRTYSETATAETVTNGTFIDDKAQG